MYNSRVAPRAFQEICKASRNGAGSRIQRRHTNSQSHRPISLYTHPLLLRCIVGLGAGITIYYGFGQWKLGELHAEVPSIPVDIKIEKAKKPKGSSKEENRDIISSQHVQVKQSWENPGVYAWGSNNGRVVAPDSDEAVIKFPRRIPYFDGQLLRDIKLDRSFGAAISENGDLLQWGTGYSDYAREPVVTLKGKGLVSLAISKDRIIGLGSNGNVYSVPVSKSDQANGAKISEGSWIPFLYSPSKISYRLLQPKSTSWGEKITSISSGLEHILLLTSSGRLFSAASSSTEFPTRGQLGIPGLGWTTRPAGAYDQLHEITTLRGFDISAIATGDYHSLALDKEGRVFAFGDDTSGQLGFDPSPEAPFVDAPSLLPIQKLYAGTGLAPRVTFIAAGGTNSFFGIDANRVVSPGDPRDTTPPKDRVTVDTWACGQGILGTLGTGRWTHVQGTPTKIKALSGLFEYDEPRKTIVPIRLKRLSVGSTHASATMDNVTHVRAGLSSKTDSPNDTNWGADVLWWGSSEFFQLGLGKRNNVALPTYIKPLDFGEGGQGKGKGLSGSSSSSRNSQEHRFQITPKHRVRIGNRMVKMEQRVECGRMVSAVYSGV